MSIIFIRNFLRVSNILSKITILRLKQILIQINESFLKLVFNVFLSPLTFKILGKRNILHKYKAIVLKKQTNLCIDVFISCLELILHKSNLFSIGNTTSSSVIKTLCGTTPPTETYTSTGPSMTILFYSDDRTPTVGYLATVSPAGICKYLNEEITTVHYHLLQGINFLKGCRGQFRKKDPIKILK